MKSELLKINEEIYKIKFFEGNRYRYYVLNNKGVFKFSEEKIANECINGVKSYLMFSISFVEEEAFKEINQILRTNQITNPNEIKILEMFKEKFKSKKVFQLSNFFTETIIL